MGGRRRANIILILLVLISFAMLTILVLASCSEETRQQISEQPGGDRDTTQPEDGGSSTPPDNGGDSTQPEEPSEPSDPITPPAQPTQPTEPTTSTPEGEEGIPGWGWLLIGIGIVLLILIVIALVRTASGRKAAAPAPAQDLRWKNNARDAYSDARWLYENITEELAVWRGDALFDTETVQTSAYSAQIDVWNQLGERLSTATTKLYGLEANAPDQRSKDIVLSVVNALNTVRSDMDSRITAHLEYRRAEAQSAGEVAASPAVEQAMQKEQQAAQSLASSRGILSGAISNLTALT